MGNDPKYATWNAEVDGANSNAFKMMNMCEKLPPEVKAYDPRSNYSLKLFMANVSLIITECAIRT